jgi:hypothetical protein
VVVRLNNSKHPRCRHNSKGWGKDKVILLRLININHPWRRRSIKVKYKVILSGIRSNSKYP